MELSRYWCLLTTLDPMVQRDALREHCELVVRGGLEDSGRQNDAKTWHETLLSQCFTTFFCHSAVPSVPAVLLHKLPIMKEMPCCRLLRGGKKLSMLSRCRTRCWPCDASRSGIYRVQMVLFVSRALQCRGLQWLWKVVCVHSSTILSLVNPSVILRTHVTFKRNPRGQQFGQVSASCSQQVTRVFLITLRCHSLSCGVLGFLF